MMAVRPEEAGDEAAIAAVTAAAFAGVPYSDQNEPLIIERLRAAGALVVSLVAEDDGVIVGHIGFSPVALSGGEGGWYGLGPVSVAPDRQGRGVGSALVRKGLDRLRALNAAGCVVLGELAYYRRFGFSNDHGLVLPNVPARYFQSLLLHGPEAFGIVTFHPGFYGTAQ